MTKFRIIESEHIDTGVRQYKVQYKGLIYWHDIMRHNDADSSPTCNLVTHWVESIDQARELIRAHRKSKDRFSYRVVEVHNGPEPHPVNFT